MKLRFFSTFLLALALFAPALFAHDARPVVVTITEQLPAAYQFSIRVPDTVEANNQPALAWPVGCMEQNRVSRPEGSNGTVLCDLSLAGNLITLDYPFYNPSLATFYRLTTLAGDNVTAMLTPTSPDWNIPVKATRGNIALEYLALGVEHIIGGLDHLLFVLGLLIIAATLKRILWTVTGFTIAHSITLSLSSLGLISIPIVPVEAVIALSIVFLAFEISREHTDSLTYHYPIIISFGFGLLHGLGFASALGEIGLVQNEIVISLLFFNLGVEAGQLAFIFLVSILFFAISRVTKNLTLNEYAIKDLMTRQRMDLIAAYVIGIPSSYWLIDRVAQFLLI
jgi:hydrogenase/urease accessory protein HupE